MVLGKTSAALPATVASQTVLGNENYCTQVLLTNIGDQLEKHKTEEAINLTTLQVKDEVIMSFN
jgi:hypothetical protein